MSLEEYWLEWWMKLMVMVVTGKGWCRWCEAPAAAVIRVDLQAPSSTQLWSGDPDGLVSEGGGHYCYKPVAQGKRSDFDRSKSVVDGLSWFFPPMEFTGGFVSVILWNCNQMRNGTPFWQNPLHRLDGSFYSRHVCCKSQRIRSNPWLYYRENALLSVANRGPPYFCHIYFLYIYAPSEM